MDTILTSRNKNIVRFMHKHDICEEIGRGYGKVIYATIKNLILALKIKNQGDKFTKVTL